MFADFPLESLHTNALKAAEAGRCAEEQGKFWEMHDQLFNNQRALSQNELSQHAQAVGLNVLTFQQCLFSGKNEPRIRASMAQGSNAGIDGTPTFMVGLTKPNSTQVKVMKGMSGAQSYAVFKSVIDKLLASQK